MSVQGLPNIGNSCYLNSAIQVLKCCPLLSRILHLPGYQSQNFMARFLGPVIDGLVNNPRLVLQQLVQKRKVQAGAQEDSHEAILEILDSIQPSKDVFGEEVYNLFQDVFKVGVKYTIDCPDCKYHSTTVQYDTFLYADYAEKLSTSMNEYFKDVTIPCENCKGDNAVRRTILKHLPKNLFICLKRYHNLGSSMSMPLEIKIGRNAFDLTGYVIHYGSLFGGHYVAEVKKDNQWYLCNDNNVTEISSPEHKNTGYVYLYVRRN